MSFIDFNLNLIVSVLIYTQPPTNILNKYFSIFAQKNINSIQFKKVKLLNISFQHLEMYIVD